MKLRVTTPESGHWMRNAGRSRAPRSLAGTFKTSALLRGTKIVKRDDRVRQLWRDAEVAGR